MAQESPMEPRSIEALLGVLVDACGRARSFVGLYDSRRVTFRFEPSTITLSDAERWLHVEALGEMSFDFGIEADGEWTHRETREPVRFELEVAESLKDVERAKEESEACGWLIGRWSAEENVLLCEPVDDRGRLTRVNSPRPPWDHVTLRVEGLRRAASPAPSAQPPPVTPR